jgi:myo-inositol-1(or 4)-monophosphatase
MRDAEVAIAAAEEAAMVVRHRFGAELRRVDKGGGDFATSADLEAEAAIRAVLDRERPADAVLGEELGVSGTSDFQRLWLADPLCGTVNFAARTPLAAVNVALSAGGRFQAAAMADPFSGETFWSGEDGAHVRLGGRDRPLIPSASSALVELNLDPPFPNAPGFRAGRFATD